MLLTSLISGKALAKFREWIVAQGGDPRVVDNPDLLPRAALVEDLPSPRSRLRGRHRRREPGPGRRCMLGGGRAKKGDAVDPAVGLLLKAKVGDRVQVGHTSADHPRQRPGAAGRRPRRAWRPPTGSARSPRSGPS